MKNLVIFILLMSSRFAFAEVGFAAPKVKNKFDVGAENGLIVFEGPTKQFAGYSVDIGPNRWHRLSASEPMVTCWKGYRPKPGSLGRWRRVGDTMELSVRVEPESMISNSKSFQLPLGVKPEEVIFPLGEGLWTKGKYMHQVKVFFSPELNGLVLKQVGPEGQLEEIEGFELGAKDYMNFTTKMKIQGWSESAPELDPSC